MNALKPVLTAEAMREADRFTIEELGIPGFTLMESAGRETAAAIEIAAGPMADKSVAVYCGKGNNGGDGLVIARYLHDRGALLRVFLLGDDLSPDASANLSLLRKLQASADDGRLEIFPLGDAYRHPPPLVHVDALLGTGLTKEVREPVRGIVEWLNRQTGFKVAVDIPTGLHTDLGRALGAAFRADLTVTMGALKTGQCLNDGPATSGSVKVVPIGIPSFTLRRPVEDGAPGCASMTEDERIRRLLPPRDPDANKYSVGLALIVGGSPGMSGAPVMAASAAARIGAGYVVCACDRRIQVILSKKLTEVTSIPLPAGDEGMEAEGALAALRERLEKARGVVIGCGLGRAAGTQEFIRRFLKKADRPVVIDADGLNAIDEAFIIQHSRGRWILTPHMGEFKRLAGMEEMNSDDRVRLAQHFAREWSCVLLLKGLPSVVAAPDGRAWICATGNPALATAGTGDVLAGMCAGLLAQGLSPIEAATAAMHIGGAAADRFAAREAARSMQATDIIAQLPSLLKERFEEA